VNETASIHHAGLQLFGLFPVEVHDGMDVAEVHVLASLPIDRPSFDQRCDGP
jgi:hypothetical protein